MARTVASLSVSINASLTGLRKGLSRAGKLVGNFKTRIAKLAGSVARLGAKAAGAAIGFAGLGTGLAARSLDKLAKTADKLDIDPTQLIALRDAAQESGVEVRQFDQGLQRMLRRIQEASKGTGEAKDTLKELGLNAKELVKLAPEVQFQKVAAAMSKAGDDGLGLSRAMKLFDTEGVALLNTLEKVNEKGLEPFVKQVKRSGRAVTRDQLRPIENVTDSLKRLGDRVGGIFVKLALAIAPVLDALLSQFEAFLNEPATVKAIDTAFKDLTKSIRDTNIQMSDLIEKYNEIKTAFEAPGKALDAAFAAGESTTGFVSRLASNPIGTVKQSASAFAERNSMQNVFKKLAEIRAAQAGGFERATGVRPGTGTINGQPMDIKPVLEKIEANTRTDPSTLPGFLPKGSMIIQVNVAG